MQAGTNGTNGTHGACGQNGTKGTRPPAKLTLIEAAIVMERLQGRAAHAGEVEALRIARDALLTIVAEGYSTLGDRHRQPANGIQAP